MFEKMFKERNRPTYCLSSITDQYVNVWDVLLEVFYELVDGWKEKSYDLEIDQLY